MAKTEGDEKIIGLLESKMQAASMTMNDMLSTMFFADGTGNSSKDFNGLKDAIDDASKTNGSSSTIYGGIDRSSYSWWSGNCDATGGAVTIDAINSMIGRCTIGEKKPDLVLTTQALYDKVWARVQPQQRFLGSKQSDLANVGFSGIDFNGHAAIVVDNHCEAGKMYLLNTDFWMFVLNKHKNFEWTEAKTPTDQDAYVRQMLTMGNLICTQPRLQGVLTGLS
jgi:hypothetical protein